MSPWGRTCAERRASGDPSAVASESEGTDARRTFGRLRMRTSPVTRANSPTTTNESSVISMSLQSTVLLTANAHDLAGGGTRSATCPSGPTYSCMIRSYEIILFLATFSSCAGRAGRVVFPAWLATLSLIHISEPTRLGMISYAVFCLKKKKKKNREQT